MEFSSNPLRIQNESGRWFLVVSHVDGGYLVRDAVTSDLVYIKHSDIAHSDDGQSAQ
jgi:hypothetical protein